MNGTMMSELIAPAHDAVVRDDAPSPSPAWHALWTRSHCEQLVHDQLAAKGFDLFLPMIDRWSRRGGLRHLIRIPMFPGYVFLHGVADKASYVEVVKAVRPGGKSIWDHVLSFILFVAMVAELMFVPRAMSSTWKAFSFAPNRIGACSWCRSSSCSAAWPRTWTARGSSLRRP